jgi:Zn-dependent membrane protease YugP
MYEVCLCLVVFLDLVNLPVDFDAQTIKKSALGQVSLFSEINRQCRLLKFSL